MNCSPKQLDTLDVLHLINLIYMGARHRALNSTSHTNASGGLNMLRKVLGKCSVLLDCLIACPRVPVVYLPIVSLQRDKGHINSSPGLIVTFYCSSCVFSQRVRQLLVWTAL